MAGLFTRITATDGAKIGVHRFGAALREWSNGGLTRAQVIAAFSLTGTEVTELDAIASTYTALPTNNVAAGVAKAAYLDRLEDVFLLCETGDYSESTAKSRLGF